jgi:hypothetical protein
VFPDDIFGQKGQLLKIFRPEGRRWTESYRIPCISIVWGSLIRVLENSLQSILDMFRKKLSAVVDACQERFTGRLPSDLSISSD